MGQKREKIKIDDLVEFSKREPEIREEYKERVIFENFYEQIRHKRVYFNEEDIENTGYIQRFLDKKIIELGLTFYPNITLAKNKELSGFCLEFAQSFNHNRKIKKILKKIEVYEIKDYNEQITKEITIKDIIGYNNQIKNLKRQVNQFIKNPLSIYENEADYQKMMEIIQIFYYGSY